MDILLVIVAMVVLGLLIGVLAGVIWKDELIGKQSVYTIAVAATVIMGLVDWLVIPALGFSEMMKYIGIVIEPPLTALLVIWLVRKAKRQ